MRPPRWLCYHANLHAGGRSSQSELVPGLEELELAEPVGVGVVEQVIPGQPTDDPRQHLGTGQLV